MYKQNSKCPVVMTQYGKTWTDHAKGLTHKETGLHVVSGKIKENQNIKGLSKDIIHVLSPLGVKLVRVESIAKAKQIVNFIDSMEYKFNWEQWTPDNIMQGKIDWQEVNFLKESIINFVSTKFYVSYY